MTTTSASVILRHLRTCVAAENTGGLTDQQLLEQFATYREEAAFEALVRRHAPLVQGVCRRVLRHEQDAEDAFQATFLVLARKAREVGRRGSVGGWLHRVAFHAAIKARARTANRDRHERQTPPRQAADLLDEVTGRELLAALDEELQKLSEDCRTSLVLCYLEGHTCDQAARQLGWSVRTLKRRLEQGRRCLRTRLARRGIALPAALLALGLTRGARAAVPAALTSTTARAAVDAAAGRVATATAAHALAQAILRGPRAARFVATAAFLALGALVFGLGVVQHQLQAQRPDPDALAAEAPAAPPEPTPLAPPGKDAGEAKKTAITGRVLDADGKPVAGVRVTAYGGLDLGRLSVERREKAFGDVKTDDEGRFRLPLPDVPGERYDRIQILAGVKGYGPAWGRVSVAADRPDVELRLPPGEAVVGRLIDLQGQPVVKARVRPVRVLPVVEKVPRAGGGQGDKAMDQRQRELAEVAAAMQAAGENNDQMKRFRDARRLQYGFEFRKDSPLKDSPLWPGAVTSDRDGRFRLDGFGKGQEVHLLVEDDHVATQEVVAEAGAQERSFSLVPPHKVTGRVIAADTDKPVANAWVNVLSFHDSLGKLVDVQTDADGRFSANAYPGESFSVEAYPPRGEPYLMAYFSSPWPKGAVKQEVEVKLPRGVVVDGKVVEAGSGKPVVSAAVSFVPQRGNNRPQPGSTSGNQVIRQVGSSGSAPSRQFTGPEGTFQMIVPPGPGHLIVTGPNPDYVYRTISEGELQNGKPGGPPRHFHAVLALDLGAADGPKEATIKLRRSVTIKGQVVGPDGKPVKDAVVFIPSSLRPEEPFGIAAVVGLPPGTRLTALTARDGSFELPNCDPDETYRLCVLSGRAEGEMRMAPRLAGMDPVGIVNRLIAQKDVLGATAEVSAKGAGAKPFEVKLGKCESAEVRFVDAAGKPVQQKMWLELLVKPGPSVAQSRAEGKPAGEAALLASPYSLTGEKSPVAPDAEGRITIPGLIPGATYRIKVLTGQEKLENETAFEKDFTVEPGKTTKLELPAPGEK
jgi:RNA polymerase sigma factor (sigma-70 family)